MVNRYVGVTNDSEHIIDMLAAGLDLERADDGIDGERHTCNQGDSMANFVIRENAHLALAPPENKK